MNEDAEPSHQPEADTDRCMLSVDGTEEKHQQAENQNVQKDALHAKPDLISPGTIRLGRLE